MHSKKENSDAVSLEMSIFVRMKTENMKIEMQTSHEMQASKATKVKRSLSAAGTNVAFCDRATIEKYVLFKVMCMSVCGFGLYFVM